MKCLNDDDEKHDVKRNLRGGKKEEATIQLKLKVDYK